MNSIRRDLGIVKLNFKKFVSLKWLVVDYFVLKDYLYKSTIWVPTKIWNVILHVKHQIYL